MRLRPAHTDPSSILRSGDKFALFTFQNFWPQPAFVAATEIEGGCWIAPGAILHPDEWLIGQRGKVFEEVFLDANFSILFRIRALEPGALTRENSELSERLSRTLDGVLIQGGVRFDQAALLGGDWTRQKGPDYRSWGMVPARFPAFRTRLRTFGRTGMRRAVRIGDNLRKLLAQEEPSRMAHGFRALHRIWGERDFEERLHQLVRAVEAPLHLEKTGTDAFVERAEFLAGTSQRDALRDVYRMRGKIEHLQRWKTAMTQYHPDRRGIIAERRVRQIEALACDAYVRILGSEQLARHFLADDAHRAFWALDDRARRRLWGPVYPLSKIR